MYKCDLSKCDYSFFSMDSKTPLRVPLSAYYKRSFAFYTVKERLPVILTKIIDYLVRDKEQIIEKCGQNSRDELKTVIGEISKLKYEIQTNKPLTTLESAEADAHIYNRYLEEQSEMEGSTRYFTAIWLHAECYMYRRLTNILENTTSLTKFDPFSKQKEAALTNSLDAVIALAEYFLPFLLKPVYAEAKTEFLQLLKLNLWGNKCDLSISAGAENSQTANPLLLLEQMEPNILANDSDKIWASIHSTERDTIDIICDNAGYELITDLFLADFLVSYKFAEKICFHLKRMPWFISDATPKDFRWIIRTFINLEHSNPLLKELGIRWNKYIREKVWTYRDDAFWTLPFPYTQLEAFDPDLYKCLANSKLLIFKGDLNYRKLFGEINWEPSTPVKEALQSFCPTKLCTLRTIKADIVCGLAKGVADRLELTDPDWMITGNYGLIQFAE